MPSAAHEELVAQIKAVQAATQDTPPPTIEQRRANFAAHMARLPVASEIEIERSNLNAVHVERIRLTGSDTQNVVILVHGGGFVLGSVDTHREFASRIARAAGCEVVSVEYRLAPEVSFPAPVDDVVSVYKSLLDEGHSPARIAMAGDSCGGGIVLSVIGQLGNLGIPMPAAGVAACPWIDLEVGGASSAPGKVDDPLMSRELLQGIAKIYLQDASPKDPRANALFADLKGFPPILIQAGTRDVLYSDAISFARKALDAEVPASISVYDGLTHVWHLNGDAIPEAKEAVDEIGIYLKRIFQS